MKKIFTTVLILAFTSAVTIAQSLTVNNAAYTIYGTSADFQLQSEFEVINTTNNSMDVLLQRYDINVLPGTTNNFCWGPNCYPPNVYLSPSPSTIPGGGTDYTFKGDYQPNGVAGVSTVAYCFFDSANPMDSICVSITYDASPTGINDVKNQDNFLQLTPSIADNWTSLNYRFKEGSKGQFKIFDLLGNLVRVIAPKGQSGTVVLPVSDLKQGIYIVSLEAAGKIASTSKLIIRHY